MSFHEKTEQALVKAFSLDCGVTAAIADFNNGILKTPDCEIFYKLGNDVDGFLDDCNLVICEQEEIRKRIFQYGFLRWAQLRSSNKRYLICVACDNLEKISSICKEVLSELVRFAEADGIEIIYDATCHPTRMAADIALIEPQIDRRKMIAQKEIFYLPKSVHVKSLPDSLGDEERAALGAVLFSRLISAAQQRLMPYRLYEIAPAEFANIITLGQADLSALEPLGNIPQWIAGNISVDSELFPQVLAECKKILECAAIWHAELSSSDAKLDIGINPETSKFDLDLFTSEIADLGIEHSVKAVLSGVPISDILV